VGRSVVLDVVLASMFRPDVLFGVATPRSARSKEKRLCPGYPEVEAKRACPPFQSTSRIKGAPFAFHRSNEVDHVRPVAIHRLLGELAKGPLRALIGDRLRT
jgi:hypothetical protein